jgi:hypothetical protein
MKPLHIVLLVVAGAVGGIGVLKLTQSTPPATPPAASAPAPTTVTSPAQVAAGTPAPAATAPSAAENPSPVRERARRQPRSSSLRNAAPAVVAQYQPPAAPAAQPAVPAPVAMPEPKSEPAPVAPAAPAPPPPPRQVTIKPGTLVQVRLRDGLSSERNVPGDQFTATLDQALVADGFVIAERGARVVGRVSASDKGGKVKGVSSLEVELIRLTTSDGQTVIISTEGFEKKGDKSRKTDAAKVGGGAALGAIIGAIAGGGKGAAIGAGVGGGAGAGDVLLTRGKAATLPSETRLSFRLKEPVTITERQR